MAWIPNTKNTSEVTFTGGVLGEAKVHAQEEFGYTPIRSLKDAHGVFAIEMTECILTGKTYIYGNLVSCHKAVLEAAVSTGKPLLMYIQKSEAFYSFDPIECNTIGIINYRGESPMVNFSIQWGKRKRGGE